MNDELDLYRLKFIGIIIFCIVGFFIVGFLAEKIHTAFFLLLVFVAVIANVVFLTMTCPFCKKSLGTMSLYRVFFTGECCEK